MAQECGMPRQRLATNKGENDILGRLTPVGQVNVVNNPEASVVLHAILRNVDQ